MINYEKDKRIKGILQIICILIGCLLLLSIFIHPVSAGATSNSTVYVNNITSTSISWDIGYLGSVRATGAMLDGVEIEGINLQYNITYLASGLEPNSTHEFCIYKDLINCDTEKTLPAPLDLYSFIFAYIWWIIAVILLVFAVQTKSSMLGFISAISCLIGMITGIQDHSFIVFMLYVVTFICAYVITESIREV